MLNDAVLLTVVFPLIGISLSILASRSNAVQRYIVLFGNMGGWIASIAVLLANVETGLPQVYRLGGWMPPFGIALAADMLSAVFGVMASTVLVGGSLYAVTCHDKAVARPVFAPLFLGMSTGLMGSLYTGDIFTLFVFVELMVISSVVLVAISDNKLGLEAALKYLLISGMGTLFLLIGIAAIYASFGTLNLADIALALEREGRPLLAQASAIMLLAAFLLKGSVFPFHFWQPDFHTTAPTPVHAVLSSVVVKVGVYGIFRVVTLLFVGEAQIIEQLLLILGIIGVFFGGLGALRTYDAKRMLAYSTFGQIGFILIAIGWGSPLALAAAIVYSVNHAFIKSSLLMIAGVVSSKTLAKTAAFAEISGVGYKMRFVGVLWFIGGLSLAGVPPFNGFISKIALIRGGIDVEAWVMLGLVVGAGLITMLYMVGTWQDIFQRKPEVEPQLKPYNDNPLAPALLISLCVGLGLYAAPLFDLAQRTVVQLGDPSIYIRAVLGS